MTLLRDDIEYAVHCEDDGTVIGPFSKTHAHLDGVRPVIKHYSTWSMVYNPKTRKYGIQLKNPLKHDTLNAGRWDMGVAGHNCYVQEKSGEYRYLNFLENLAKEAEEEIGLKLELHDNFNSFIAAIQNLSQKALGYIFDEFAYETDKNNEWVGLGLIITDNESLEFIDGEVIDFKWLSPDELKTFCATETNYCAPLPMVVEKAEAFRKKCNI